MRAVNEFIATGPFDIYELQLFHLVAEHRSFTKAGRAAGLSQSAITRQIRGMEEQLGVALFERTTRSVQLTQAGAALYARSGAILSEVNSAIDALRKGFYLSHASLRIGISRTIGLAYLPGFFHQFQKKFPKIKLTVSHESGSFIAAAVESGELDAGILTAPPQLPSMLEITQRFRDEFTVIAPPQSAVSQPNKPLPLENAIEIFQGERWLLVSAGTTTGKLLRGWITRQHLKIKEILEADNFDLIVNLVSLGLGVSIVPHRVLALQGQRRPVKRFNTKPKFARDLIVVVRKRSEMPAELRAFVENILF